MTYVLALIGTTKTCDDVDGVVRFHMYSLRREQRDALQVPDPPTPAI